MGPVWHQKKPTPGGCVSAQEKPGGKKENTGRRHNSRGELARQEKRRFHTVTFFERDFRARLKPLWTKQEKRSYG